jgi:cation diffusion facilitator family transporter
MGSIVSTFKCCNPLTNESVLQIAAITFLIFVITEFIGAMLSNSLSLLGDAAAMSVDVLSYWCNLYAERIKSQNGYISLRTRYFLVVVIPSFSIFCLILVTIYITYDAIIVLNNKPKIDDVDVDYLYGFGVFNLFVDIFCGYLFYLKGSDTFIEHNTFQPFHIGGSDIFLNGTDLDNEDIDEEFGHLDENLKDFDEEYDSEGEYKVDINTNNNKNLPIYEHLYNYLFCVRDIDNNIKKNFNMISAFTHVGGDTIRTFTVFIAAFVSSFTNIDTDIADSWAAIVCSVSIVSLVVPLILEIRLEAKSFFNDNNASIFQLPSDHTNVLSSSRVSNQYMAVRSESSKLLLSK